MADRIISGTLTPALLGLAIALAACAPAAGPPDPSGQAPSQAEKQYGGVFQYAAQTPPDGLYWFDFATIGGRGRPMAASQIWDGLINFELTKPEAAYEAAGRYAPALAEKWSQPDTKTFVFNLHRGVKWHDGREFTSKDVVWSLTHWGDTTSERRLRTLTGRIESFEATGPYEVRLVLKKADPEFFLDLARPDYKIMAAHVAEQAGNPVGDDLRALYEKNVIGTGPFKLRSFDRQRHLETERFDEYWRGRPYLDGTRTVFGIERSGMQAAFIARQLDYVSLDDRVQFDTVKAVVSEAKRQSYVTGHNWGIQFNVTRPPFDDVRVRRAIHLGIDRQKLLDAVTFGEGKIAGPAPVLPTLSEVGVGMTVEEFMKLPGWRPQRDQDIAEAKKLLAEAGYPNGFKAVMAYRRGISHPTTQSEPIASQLKAIGLDIEVRPMEPGLYAEQVYRRKDFDLINDGMTSGYAVAAVAYSKWHTKGAANYSQISDPQLDRLLETALGESDNTKRNELFTQMQRVIVDKAYYAPIVTLTQHLALQPWVHEFFPSFSVSPELLDASRLWLDVNIMPDARRSF